jgi:hypothetical protein
MKSMKRAAAPGSGPQPAKLYWCTTPDHDEDWFVIARTAASARLYHEREEVYGAGDADAELVCDVPARFAKDAPCWPSDAALEACGRRSSNAVCASFGSENARLERATW